MDSRKKFAVAIGSTCANRRDGGGGNPKPGHRADVGSFQTDSPALEGTISYLRLEGLKKDAPRPGRIPSLPQKKVRAVVQATLHTTPRGATHWSIRTMAKAQGISRMAVQRIWDRHGLKPHLTKTFKLSRDQRFVEKLYDVVGLYLNPPDKALVLCVDEKSQIQALDRTQPGLPIKKGRCGTMTHD